MILLRMFDKRLFEEAPNDGAPGGGAEPPNSLPSNAPSSGSSSTQGEGTPDPRAQFLEMIPEDLRASASLNDINNVGDLAKSYVHAQQMIGRARVALPGENATDAERQEFFEAIGRPKTPDEYGIKKPDEYPKDLPYSEEITKGFTNLAHEIGLTKDQAAKIHDWYVKGEMSNYQNLNQQVQQEFADQMKELMNEYGSEAVLNERLNIAQFALRQLGDEETTSWLEETGLGNHPKIIKIFAKAGQMLREDGLLQGVAGSNNFSMTPEEAKSRLAELQRDRDFMRSYLSASQPGHREAVQKVQELNKAAYPSDKALFSVGENGLAAMTG